MPAVSRPSSRRAAGVALAGACALLAFSSCSSSSSKATPGALADAGEAGVPSEAGKTSVPANAGATVGASDLAAGNWSDALTACTDAEKSAPDDCDARYCELIAKAMLANDMFNTFIFPTYRSAAPLPASMESVANAAKLQQLSGLITDAASAADTVIAKNCETYLPVVPWTFGDGPNPLVKGEIRGWWTVRDAHLLDALLTAVNYDGLNNYTPQAVPPVPAGQTNPALPMALASMQQHLQAEDMLLFQAPVQESDMRGGWVDRNGNGIPDGPDELLVDIFTPGTQTRVFDFSQAEFVKGEALPQGQLTPTAQLPAATCGYQQFHIDDLVTGANVGTADGVTLSPDGTKAAFPLLVNGKFEVNSMNLDGTGLTCLTCGQGGPNDGARWRPVSGDTILFVSNRDHPYAIGGDGAGFGQELYAMLPDGTKPTRLTTSDPGATNYHANWSPDGTRIVWGTTQNKAWDVMVADFISDSQGMRLGPAKRIVHDTTWWETHGFSADGGSILATNTRAGFLSTDIYSIDLASGARQRLTTDLTWDEHAHLSPDGSRIAWIATRWHPAAVSALTTAGISPIYDFLWIVPGIYFDFLDPPVGYSSELTLMNADATNVRQLTTDGVVVADNQWSSDGKKIIFRQSDPNTMTTKIRVLTFDDCK